MRLIAAIGVTILLGVGGFVIYHYSSNTNGNAQMAAAAHPQETVTIRPPFKSPRTPPSGFEEYRSVFYRFQLLHPEYLNVSEYPEPVSTITLVFDSDTRPEIFQLFIIPHGDPDITEFRLTQDLPSGILQDVQDVEFAGVPGKAFVSQRDGMGETREVWFVARGFLYEVSAPLKYDEWLAQLLRDWEFL